MITGIGVDAADIERSLKLSRRAVEKIFHPDELKQLEEIEISSPLLKGQFLASRFAVKEAYAKARGTGFCEIVVPSEICTCKDEKGRPFIKLYGKTAENARPCNINLSITHQMPLAVAFVVLEAPDVQK